MIEKYNFRKAKIEEFDYIENLFDAVKEDLKTREIVMWTDRYPLDVIENDINTDSMYVMEDENNEILGCFTLLDNDDLYRNINWNLDGKSLYIERVIINPKLQGQGLSKKIMDFIMKYAKEKEYEIIRLTVLETNPRAHSLYKKYDFIESDKGSHMTRSGRVAIAMERNVN